MNYEASYDAPLTRKTRLQELPNMLLLFFDVTGSKKMILGEMINFAKKVHCKCFPHKKYRESPCRKVYPAMSM